MQHLEHLFRQLRAEGAPLADQAQHRHQAVGRDAIADAVLERQLVLHAAPQVHAVDPEPVQRALQDVEPDEVEQQVRREVAAGRDHVAGELRHAQRAPDLTMHFGVGIPVHAHPVGRAVVRAEEPVAHVHARLRQQVAAMDRAVDADQDGDLDRARRVEPAVGVVLELGACLQVVERDRDGARLRLLLELGEARTQRVRVGNRGNRGDVLCGKSGGHGGPSFRKAGAAASRRGTARLSNVRS